MNAESGASCLGQRRFGILCVLGYVVLSWAVRFDMDRGEQIASLVYPLDTFSMYAQSPSPEISHILIRETEGAVHAVTEFRVFDCDAPVTGAAAACADHQTIRYLYEEISGYVESHPGSGTDDVELIARTWRLRPGAPVEHESDCVIAHCRVSR